MSHVKCTRMPWPCQMPLSPKESVSKLSNRPYALCSLRADKRGMHANLSLLGIWLALQTLENFIRYNEQNAISVDRRIKMFLSVVAAKQEKG